MKNITRTIETDVVEITFYNNENKQVEKFSATFEAGAKLSKIKKAVAPHTYLEHTVVGTEAHKYAMPIDEFIKNATEITE